MIVGVLSVTRRLQMKQTGPVQYATTLECLSAIARNEGLAGFYKGQCAHTRRGCLRASSITLAELPGLSSKIVQSVLNAAFLVLCQEQLVQAISFAILRLLGKRAQAPKLPH